MYILEVFFIFNTAAFDFVFGIVMYATRGFFSVWSRFDRDSFWTRLRQCGDDVSCRQSNTAGDKTLKLKTNTEWGAVRGSATLFLDPFKNSDPPSFLHTRH